MTTTTATVDLDLDALFEAVLEATETSNANLPELPPRPVPSREEIERKLFDEKFDADDRVAIEAVFGRPDALVCYRCEPGVSVTPEIMRARYAVNRLRVPRPVPSRWVELLSGSKYELRIVELRLGMADGDDWPLPQIAAMFGRPFCEVERAFTSAQMRLNGYKRPAIQRAAKIRRTNHHRSSSALVPTPVR
ncbi:MAG: hypothetical protein V1895_01795 [Parcubacteria group bacterium]